MLAKRITATAAVAVWIVTLAYAGGPARWELAHTYQHLIEGVGSALNAPTVAFGLPILGLGPRTFQSVVVTVVIWGVAWLGPIILLVGIWRVRTREALSDWLLLGGVLYGSVMLLFLVVIAVSLWLPFSLL